MEKNIPELKRKIVMLTLTENCNLACVYCFEKAKTKKVMDLEVAKTAISYEFQNTDDFDEIEIDLFGGEPTLCIDLIKELVEWTNLQNFSKPYVFFLETNGTNVHGEFQDWLLKNRDYVWSGLSLDGTPETHNKTRSNSYDNIDVNFFVKTYPNQSVRMTIYNETIQNLSNDIKHLHKLGFQEVAATFAFGINWNTEKIQRILKNELKNLCDFYIKNPSLKECSIFDMHLPEIVRKKKKIAKWCGSGTHMVSYGIDGTKYPCQTFQQNTTLNRKSLTISEIDFSIGCDIDPECLSCVIESICPSCYGMNYVKEGNIFKRDKELCEVVKARALATSYLKIKQIEKNSSNMKPNEVYQTLNAIKIIQKHFN